VVESGKQIIGKVLNQTEPHAIQKEVLKGPELVQGVVSEKDHVFRQVNTTLPKI
jgi:hypothetical protein